MHCPGCGQQVSDNTSFCGSCGTSIGSSASMGPAVTEELPATGWAAASAEPDGDSGWSSAGDHPVWGADGPPADAGWGAQGDGGWDHRSTAPEWEYPAEQAGAAQGWTPPPPQQVDHGGSMGGSPGGGWYGAPAQTQWVPAPAPEKKSPLGLILGALALLAIVAGGVYFLLNRSDGGGTTEAQTTPTVVVTATATAGANGPAASPSAPTHQATPTPAPTPVAIEMAPTSQSCPASAGGLSAYRGNDQTSCPFTAAVFGAYLAHPDQFQKALTLSRVYSPVRDQYYDMDCDFTTPVVCHGGNAAVVYIVGNR